MDQTVAPSPPKAPLLTIPRWEFIAITAGLMALNALAIDIMLVALQQIGMSLAVEDENSRQLVVTAYVIGFGLTQLLFGPISDRYGRRVPLLVGLGVYVVAAFACAFAPTFTILLALRFIQGLTERVAICYTIAMTAIFGALFGFINSAQQVYIGIYDVGEMFPVYFAVVAGLMAVSSFLNARMVGRFGMRRLAHGALIGFLAVTALSFGLALLGPIPFWLFLTLFAIAMMQFSWIGSNFNSLAMEPLGHVAGTASSVQGFLQTVGGGVVGALIGQSFDGTVAPLAGGYFFAALIALVMTLVAEKGQIFKSHNAPV